MSPRNNLEALGKNNQMTLHTGGFNDRIESFFSPSSSLSPEKINPSEIWINLWPTCIFVVLLSPGEKTLTLNNIVFKYFFFHSHLKSFIQQHYCLNSGTCQAVACFFFA